MLVLAEACHYNEYSTSKDASNALESYWRFPSPRSTVVAPQPLPYSVHVRVCRTQVAFYALVPHASHDKEIATPLQRRIAAI